MITYIQHGLFYIFFFSIPFWFVKFMILYQMYKTIGIPFNKRHLLYSSFYTFIYYSTKFLNEVLRNMTFYIFGYTDINSMIKSRFRDLIFLLIMPTICYKFLKATDQEDYDYYIGENARGPSFVLFDLTTPSSSERK